MKIIVYTHDDVKWVWPHWYKQTKKYLNDYEKVMFVNNIPSKEDNYSYIEYNSNLKYTKRVVSCLEHMNDEEVIIFHHEDMFLYDSPNLNLINEYKKLVQEDKVHLIKLLRNGDSLPQHPDHPSLYYNPSYLFFAIQPTIIKVKTLKEIYSTTPGNTIWEFEASAMLSSLSSKYTSCFAYNQGSKRGKNHWDSNIYPYIATAVVKGKWNLKEYPNELNTILYPITSSIPK